MYRLAEPAIKDSQSQRAFAADPVMQHRNWIDARDMALQALWRGTKLTAILGPPGAGKTRMLEDLARTLEASGVKAWLRPPGEAVFGSDGDGVVLLDEDCHLNAEIWTEMFQSPGRYVIAGQPMLAEYLRTFPSDVEALFINPRDADDAERFVAAQPGRDEEVSGQLMSDAVGPLMLEAADDVPQMSDTLAGSELLPAGTGNAGSNWPGHGDEGVAGDGGNALTADPPAGSRGPEVRTRQPAGTRLWDWKAIGLVCAVTMVGAWAVAKYVGSTLVHTPMPANSTNAAPAAAQKVVSTVKEVPAGGLPKAAAVPSPPTDLVAKSSTPVLQPSIPPQSAERLPTPPPVPAQAVTTNAVTAPTVTAPAAISPPVPTQSVTTQAVTIPAVTAPPVSTAKVQEPPRGSRVAAPRRKHHIYRAHVRRHHRKPPPPPPTDPSEPTDPSD
jgi:hypothetical protein